MRKFIYAALVGLTGACASGAEAPQVNVSSIGEELGCGPGCCPCPGCCPWPSRGPADDALASDPLSIGEAMAAPGADDVIVGPDDLKEPACFPVSSGIPFNSSHVGRFRQGGGAKVCSLAIITKDSWALTSAECAPSGAVLGDATFGYQKTQCGGTVLSSSSQTYQADQVVADGALLWVHLAGNPFAVWNSAKLGINTIGPLVNGTDELFALGHTTPTGGTKADADCHAGPWTKTASGAIAPTDCDVVDEEGRGAPVYLDFNACVVVPGGCAPGTGPTTPGATPGRLVGTYVGDLGGRSGIVSLSHAVRPGSVGDAIVFGTPNNYVP